MGEFRGHYPNQLELAAVPGAVSDLGRFVNYAALLGSATEPAGSVAAALALAIQWRAVKDSTEAWDAYVKAQDALAWKAALAMLDDLRPVFVRAAVKTPALATQYPWLARLLSAGKAVAQSAVATKAKKAKAASASAVANAKAAASAIATAAKSASDTVTANAAAAATASAAATVAAAAALTPDPREVPAAAQVMATKAVTPGQ